MLTLLHIGSRLFELFSIEVRVKKQPGRPLKICYDKAGNLPNKDRNFNKQTWGKIVYFLFV